MVNPGLALFVVLIIALSAALVFWPDKGLLGRRKKTKESGQKVLMEDALKFIYDADSRNITCNIDSLSRALKSNHHDVEAIIIRLRSLRLLQVGEGYKLSTEGKDYALRVLRIHRLWERYLAEETGIPETEWHREAERQEHKMTIEEANELSRHLGYPRYDPHGDPIPTRSGDLPPERGRSLYEFSRTDIVRVVHIEDEPPELYEEIVSKGIYLENHIEILKKLNNSMHILTNGESKTISMRMAENITAVQAQEDPQIEEPVLSLSSLASGERAEVINISKACRGSQRRRLMDLGIVPGTIISMEMVSAGGDPTAYNIRGAVIALRKDQSQFVNVQQIQKVTQNVS